MIETAPVQSCQSIDIIAVDDRSSDDTAAVAKKFGADVFHEPVRGRSQAQNFGIRKYRGNLIMFLDADCTLQRGWLSELLKPFDDPATGCVAGAILNSIDTATPFSEYLIKKGHLAQSVYFNHSFYPFAATGNAAFRRAVLDQIGLFDEAIFLIELGEKIGRIEGSIRSRIWGP